MEATRQTVAEGGLRMLIGGAVLFLALISGFLGPEAVGMGLGGLLLLALVVYRPEWGVGALLIMFMVQYRWISRSLAAGGLSINNSLGLLLLAVMLYRLYRDGDWSFLRSRQVQLMGVILAGIVFLGILHPVNREELLALGLMPPSQDPVRLMVSRGFFLVFFVFFIRSPRELRLLVGVFILLSLVVAFTGTSAGLAGSGMEVRGGEGYRAGGREVVARIAANPNRLAMVAVLVMTLIWEYAQSERGRRWAWLASLIVLGLVLTVFLTASRGGLIGLTLAGLLLASRRRARARRWVYGAMVGLAAVAMVEKFVPEENLQRLSSIPGFSQDSSDVGEGSLRRRQYTLKIALNLFARHPLVGVGVGHWEKERFLRDPARSGAVPHNSYMLALVEQGLPALTLYLLLFGVTLRQLIRIERHPDVMQRARREGLDWMVSGTRLCLVLFMVFSLFADLWENITMYLLLGMAAVLVRRYLPEQSPPRPA